jgi:hypothetical protein
MVGVGNIILLTFVMRICGLICTLIVNGPNTDNHVRWEHPSLRTIDAADALFTGGGAVTDESVVVAFNKG